MSFVLRVATASLLLATMGIAAEITEKFHSTQPLPAGGPLRVSNVNGSVEITGWDQDTVDIAATKYGSSQELLDEVKIDVQALGGGVSIRTIVPEHRNGGAGARLVLKVPRRVSLEDIATSNGGVRVSGIEGPAKLAASNGPIHVELTGGPLNADTSNGAIEATLRNPNSGDPVVLDTSNGRISLTLDTASIPEIRADTSNSPIEIHLLAGTNARLEASTSNGGVSSDFEVTTRSFSKNSLQGTIGGGGPLVKLSTSNSPIRVLRN